MFDFLSGSVAFGFLVAALFFLRFWKRTDDGLFLAFAIAFGLLGLGQAVQALANIPHEEREYIFLIRLLAFSVLIAAIFRKNRAAKQ
ncbi:hypothetical protein G7077_02725 [Sphingomonas piscis]|uniref:Uncharacterized protein n=1 Tax=Sphingomonas piscis TaxID=2714943 RepID=A0A6G7YT27_9SPHN|nr:hypothetical protein G7077_02725 [Sphingomonas piscis]